MKCNNIFLDFTRLKLDPEHNTDVPGEMQNQRSLTQSSYSHRTNMQKSCLESGRFSVQSNLHGDNSHMTASKSLKSSEYQLPNII